MNSQYPNFNFVTDKGDHLHVRKWLEAGGFRMYGTEESILKTDGSVKFIYVNVSARSIRPIIEYDYFHSTQYGGVVRIDPFEYVNQEQDKITLKRTKEQSAKIESLVEQIDKAKAILEKLEKELEEAKKVKWSPKCYSNIAIVTKEGRVFVDSSPTEEVIMSGRTYPTKELAKYASKQLYINSIILNFVLENDPEYRPNWSDLSKKFYIYYNHKEKHWDTSYDHNQQCISKVYMPADVASKLLKMIDSGEFIIDV